MDDGEEEGSRILNIYFPPKTIARAKRTRRRFLVCFLC
jgi:hypothetical protein